MKLILLILIIFTVFVIIYYKYINKKNRDYFITPKNNSDTINIPIKTYSFLHDDNYSKAIIDKYYVNDDIKINNNRVVKHPYQYKTNQYYGNQRYLTYNSKTMSDIIYINTGVRI